MDAVAFIDLPSELLSEILSVLDVKTLLLCSAVCKLWHETVKSTPELQCTLELWADGMVRGHSGALTCTETLEALRERRRAWKDLEWTSKTVVEIQSLLSCRAYELVGGVFAQQHEGPEFHVISLSDIMDDPRSVKVTRTMGPDLHDFQDFTIDPTQDLVVFLFVARGGLARLEARTISARQPHPLAASPFMDFMVEHSPQFPVTIQVADDVIGIFLPRLGFFIINWRTGAKIIEMVVPHLTPSMDFHFLSSRSYIMTRGSDDVQNPIGIELFTFEDRRHSSPTKVAILQLPELSWGSVVTIRIQAGAFCAKPISGPPFSKSNEHRIFTFLISVAGGANGYRLFVHHRWLYKYVRDYGTETAVVPWAEWGPRNSRMLPSGNLDLTLNRHVHGERVALPCDQPNFLQILDFGAIPGRVGAATELQMHTSSRALPRDGAFRDAVVTSLPYRRTLRALHGEHNVFLIDQDHIIGVDISDDTFHQMTVYTI
ncbi:hypothetical protein DFH06DRAFT_1249610 [Mycena polygramma]|nr:hypothetical protein DFH06DRAFT_1249610 [Mycena polygramma]